MSAQNQNWCFTLNNYTDEQVLHLSLLAEDPRVAYLVIGREVAPTTGTPHIQGFVRFNSRLRLSSVRALLPVCHCTSARGTAEQNRTYCIKDGDFDEWGTCPVDQQGRRSDFERYVEWLRTLESEPSERELIDQWPSLYGRYRGALRRMAGEICPRPTLRDGELREWQTALLAELDGPANDRTVRFVVDNDGGHGKSWFCGYAFSKLDGVQILGPGKRDDLAHAVDVRTRIFLFNIPRGNAEYLNYGLLEMIKDRMVLSPKYESQMKILQHTPHVVVFMNEQPDMTKMTADRYDITQL
nr:MAG: replication associated protein [ssDNA virus sp.]